MRHTRTRTIAAACALSGIPSIRAPRAGWRRDTAGDTGDPNPHGGGGTGPGDGDGQGDKGAPADSEGKKPEIKGDYDPDRAVRALAAARDGEKKAKDRATAAEKAVTDLKDNLAVALGLKPDPKSDPAALAAQAAKELADTRAALATKTRENAVLRLAGKAGGDIDRLLDSRTFSRTLAELGDNPSDEQVTTAIKDAIKAHPSLAATAPQGGQGPARQGADHTGSGGGGRQRPTSLGAALAAASGN